MPVLAALQSTFVRFIEPGSLRSKTAYVYSFLRRFRNPGFRTASIFLSLIHQAVDPCANRFEFNLTMLSVYFDTNVYDQIDKGKLSSADLEALRLAFNDS